jgi:hypothetical protein
MKSFVISFLAAAHKPQTWTMRFEHLICHFASNLNILQSTVLIYLAKAFNPTDAVDKVTGTFFSTAPGNTYPCVYILWESNRGAIHIYMPWRARRCGR